MVPDPLVCVALRTGLGRNGEEDSLSRRSQASGASAGVRFFSVGFSTRALPRHQLGVPNPTVF